jgi:hypothetical protein
VHSGLQLTVVQPSGRLASYVRGVQVLSTDEPSARVRVLDFGGADVSVPLCFGDPIFVHGPTPTVVPSAAMVGPRTRAVWLQFDGLVDQVNVSFLPGVAGAFADVSLSELVGRVAAPDHIWPGDFREAAAELKSATLQERISRLEQLLLGRLEPRLEPGPQVREAVRLIQATDGRVRVRALADHVKREPAGAKLQASRRYWAKVARSRNAGVRFGRPVDVGRQ